LVTVSGVDRCLEADVCRSSVEKLFLRIDSLKIGLNRPKKKKTVLKVWRKKDSVYYDPTASFKMY